MADNNTIARPYAQALFDSAREHDALQAAADGLEIAKEVLTDGQVAKFLANPGLDNAQRLSFLQDLFANAGNADNAFAGSHPRATNFLRLLLEYGRVNVLPEIAEHFDALKARVENTIDVTIRSAAPLSDKDKNEFTSALKNKLGRDVNIETETDESLIGGAVITAGDVVIDGSLRARLNGLANALIA